MGAVVAVAVNVLTCVAYLAAGVWGYWWHPDGAGLVFAAWMVWLGISSAIHHARAWSLVGLRLDHSGMYGTFVAVTIHAISNHSLTWIAMLAVGVYVGWSLAFGPDRVVVASMTILQPMMIVLGMLSVLAVLLEGQWVFVPLVLGCLSIAWWAWHQPGWWGHGMWHVLTATAIALLFLGVR